MTPESMVDFASVIARTVLRSGKVPPTLSFDDLVSEGVEAILLAQQRYNPNLGTKFSTFIWQRTSGAMWDLIRQWHWGPRRKNNRDKSLYYSDRYSYQMNDIVNHERQDDIENVVDHEFLRTMMADLSPRQREVLHKIYWEDQTLEQVSQDLGCSSPNVCNLRSRAIKKMQEVAVV